MPTPDDPIGPPFPGEKVVFYDGTKVYWNIVPDGVDGKVAFTAANGVEVKIDRKTGAIIT